MQSGQSHTRVAAEPELQRDVQGVHRGAAGDNFRGEGFTAIAVIVARGSTLVQQVGELRDVADHLSITSLLSRFLGEFVPNVEPVTIVLVDTLSTDFDFNVVDQVVTNPVQPTELSTRAIG